MISRDDLLTSIRPLAEALALDLATLICERFNGQLEQALDVARSALASDLARIDDQPRPSTGAVKAHRDRANMLRREADAASAARLPNPRRTATCRSCGRVGFTSKGCGTTHEPLAEPPPIAAHRPAVRSVRKVATTTTEPPASSSPPPARAARGVPAPAPVPSPIPPPVLEVEEDDSDIAPEPEPEIDDSVPATQDDEEDELEVVAPAPRPGRRDRFAEIEALAKAREAAERQHGRRA